MIQLIIIFFGVNKILQNVCGVTNLVLLIATKLRVCLVGVFLEGMEGKRSGAKFFVYSPFCFPQIGGIWRGRKINYYNFYYIDIIIFKFILKCHNYPY
jgi:hypothetical membrane protein